MITKTVRYTLGFVGLAGSLAFIAAAPVHAQQQPSGGNDLVPITGGSASFVNTQIFVPNSKGTDTLVHGYGNNLIKDGSLFIQTTRGDIPTPILFQPGPVPTLSTCYCQKPAVGDEGSVTGNLSFRAFTANGQPALFVGVPTKLDFTVTAINPTGNTVNSTLYSTPPDYTLITSGGVVTSGGSVQTGSASGVSVFQVQPEGEPKENVTILGTTIPKSDFTGDSVKGKDYPADLDVEFTDGFVTIPESIGFSPTGSSNNGSNNSNSRNNNSNPNFVTSDTTYTPPSGVPINVGSDSTGSGRVYQVGNNYYVTVGLSSRVWPGLIGVKPMPNPSLSQSPNSHTGDDTTTADNTNPDDDTTLES